MARPGRTFQVNFTVKSSDGLDAVRPKIGAPVVVGSVAGSVASSIATHWYEPIQLPLAKVLDALAVKATSVP
jgi:hypothetical protein